MMDFVSQKGITVNTNVDIKNNKGVSESSEAGPRAKSKLRENIEAIVIALILALFIRTFIIQAFKIPSGSMEPTLLVGDHILVNKFIYGVRLPYIRVKLIPVSTPSRGDIIVFKYPVNPDMDFIKRVVGLPGDTIEIKNKRVFINGKLWRNDPGVHGDLNIIPRQLSKRDNFGPVTVPEGSYFVMGDNRDNSLDSRFWGFVPDSDIEGKAFIIYWSWDHDSFSVRWNRLGMILH